jgi:hypothetical protein
MVSGFMKPFLALCRMRSLAFVESRLRNPEVTTGSCDFPALGGVLQDAEFAPDVPLRLERGRALWQKTSC